QQLFPRFVAHDPPEGLVEVQESPAGSGEEGALLHVLKQVAKFFLGTAARGHVAQQVQRRRTSIRAFQRRSRRGQKAPEVGVAFARTSRNLLAIRAVVPMRRAGT